MSTPILRALILCVSFALWSADTADIRLAINPWIANSPANVAETKGFWTAEGISVEVICYDTDSEMTDSLLNGKTQLCLTMLGSAITWSREGRAVAILAETDWSHGGDKFILGKGRTLAGLKGQLVGVYDTEVSVRSFVAKVLERAGLSLADVELVEMDTDPLTSQLLAGKLAAVATYDPAAKAALEGGGTLVATTADFPGCMPEGLVGFRPSLAALGRDKLARFLRGWVKAVAWSQDPANWQEYCTIVRTKTFTGDDAPADADAVRELLAGVRIHDRATLLERNRTGLPAWLESMRSFLRSADGVTDFDATSLFDPAPVLAAVGP